MTTAIEQPDNPALVYGHRDYRRDIRWRYWQNEFVADLRPGECAASGLVRRTLATFAMYQIETAYEHSSSNDESTT